MVQFTVVRDMVQKCSIRYGTIWYHCFTRATILSGGLLQSSIVGDCKQWQCKCMQCKVMFVPWPAAEVSTISPVPESVSCHTIPSRLTLVPGSHGPSCSGSVTVLASVTVPASTCNKKYFKFYGKYFLQIP